MEQTNASVRVQKLDEAKEIIAELEEQKGLERNPPGRLSLVSGNVRSMECDRSRNLVNTELETHA